MLINNIIEEIQLQPALGEIMKIFTESPSEFISTIDFLSRGVLSPAAGISRLRNMGAIIETEFRAVTDSDGRTRKRIAHYRLVEWSSLCC